jgi:hypothetical protein
MRRAGKPPPPKALRGRSKIGSRRVRNVDTSNAAKAATTLPASPLIYGVVGIANAHTRKATVEAPNFHQGHRLSDEGNAGSPELRLFPANTKRKRVGVRSNPKNQYKPAPVTTGNVAVSADIAADAATYSVITSVGRYRTRESRALEAFVRSVGGSAAKGSKSS